MDNIYAFIIALLLAVAVAKVVIPLLHRFKFGQMVREDGPQSHVKKNGTPTMGGIIFIVPVVVCSLLFMELSIEAQYPMIALVIFSFVGFYDDFLKIRRGSNLGLTAKQKMILLFVVALVLSFLGGHLFGTEINIPFIKGFTIDLGLLYYPLMMFVFIGASNSVNLTDGLDGLAATVTLVALCCLMIIMNLIGQGDNIGIMVISCAALIGFLKYNRHPAKIFMGDTGSLGLGGLLVALTAQISNPLILIFVGMVYIIETLSVIIQVLWFKKTGKRIFKMSPIHHHYEMEGLSEVKIVLIFTGITIFTGIIGVISVVV